MYTNRWSKLQLSTPYVTKGSRPVCDQHGNCYIFSGEALNEGLSTGLRICTTDFTKVDLVNQTVERVKASSKQAITGRKNFAMSECDGWLFVAGG